MDFIKAIINLISSWFQRSTVQTKKEVKLADAETKAVVETIRASENATAVQQQEKVQQAIKQVQAAQTQIKHEQDQQSIDERIDSQFGSED